MRQSHAPRSSLCTLVPMLWVLAACEGTGNLGAGEPVIFPQTARLGDEVAMVIDSNYAAQYYTEQYDLTTENVELRLYDPSEPTPTLLATLDDSSGIEAVFALQPAPNSEYGGDHPGADMTVVVFRLPATLANFTPPGDLFVEVYKADASAGVTSYFNTMTISGSSSDPPIDLNLDLTDFALSPGIRLIPVPEPDGGFDPGWKISAIKLGVYAPTAKLTNLRVAPATEASRSTALVVDRTGGFYDVLVMDLEGFSLQQHDCDPPGSHCASQGPLLDLVFDRLATFNAGDVLLLTLELYRPDGMLLAESVDPTDYFDKLAVQNVEPAP